MKLVEKSFYYLSELLKDIKTTGNVVYDEDATSGYHWNFPDNNILYQQSPQTKPIIPCIYIYFNGLDFYNDGEHAASIGDRYTISINYEIVALFETTIGNNDLLTRSTHAISDILTCLKKDLYLTNISSFYNDASFGLDHHVLNEVKTDAGFSYPKGLAGIQGNMMFYNILLTEI